MVRIDIKHAIDKISKLDEDITVLSTDWLLSRTFPKPGELLDINRVAAMVVLLDGLPHDQGKKYISSYWHLKSGVQKCQRRIVSTLTPTKKTALVTPSIVKDMAYVASAF